LTKNKISFVGIKAAIHRKIANSTAINAREIRRINLKRENPVFTH